MGLFEKVVDKALKLNTTYLPYDKLAEIVKNEFIDGADADQLRKVKKAAKGGPDVTSISGKYSLGCSVTTNFSNIIAIFAPKRAVYIEENGTKNLFQLDKEKNYRKFRKAVMAYLDGAK